MNSSMSFFQTLILYPIFVVFSMPLAFGSLPVAISFMAMYIIFVLIKFIPLVSRVNNF